MSSLKGQKRILCRMLLFLLLVILLTACGGNEDGGSSLSGNTTTPDACTLLSVADVETVLGSSASSTGTVDEGGLFSTCTWLDTTSGARLMLNIWAAGNVEDGWASQFLTAQSGVGGNATIENLGDEAYALIDGDFSNYYWRKGDLFVVAFTTTGSEASEDVLLELARKIDDGF